MNGQMEKEYFNIEEVAETLGWNRATVYKWMKTLDIKSVKFKLNKKSYIAAADVERLKEAKDKPWLAGIDEGESDSKDAA